MLLPSDERDRLRHLMNEIRGAEKVARPFMARVVAMLGRRVAALPSAAPSKQIAALLDAEAWTDATLALLALELPQWKLRRIAYDDGAWRCSLGKQPSLPEWLDDSVEVAHLILPLAIVGAMIEAKVATPIRADGILRSVPPVPQRDAAILCCDNFA